MRQVFEKVRLAQGLLDGLRAADLHLEVGLTVEAFGFDVADTFMQA